MRDEFSSNADQQKAREIRFRNDSATLNTIWNGNDNLRQTIKALTSLRGKNYHFVTGTTAISSTAKPGEEYAPPFLNFEIQCRVSRGLLKKSDESNLLISVNMDGGFTFSMTGGVSKTPVTVTSGNAASNALNQWLVDLNARYGIDCISDLNRAKDQAESQLKKTQNRQPTPKAA